MCPNYPWRQEEIVSKGGTEIMIMESNKLCITFAFCCLVIFIVCHWYNSETETLFNDTLTFVKLAGSNYSVQNWYKW